MSLPLMRRYLISLACLLPLAAVAQFRTLSFQHLTIQQGLANNYAMATAQDDLGFIWTGTSMGLSRFDGIRCITFTHQIGNQQSLSHKIIRSLFKSKNGTFWVGTQRGLNRFDYQTQTFQRYFFSQLGEDCNFIRCIAESPNGKLWLGTNNGLVMFDPTTATSEVLALPTDEDSKPSVYNIRSLLIDGSTLWIGTRLGLYAYNMSTKKFRVYCQSEEVGSLPDNYVSSLAKNPKTGEIMVGSRGGVLVGLDTNDGSIRRLSYTSPNQREISSLLYARDGTLWISTMGDGLYRHELINDRFVVYLNDRNDPLSICSNQIKHIFQDKSGVVWVATTDLGLSRFNPTVEKFNALFSQINYVPPSTSASDVARLAIDSKNNVWVATRDGLVWINRQNHTYKIYRHDPANPYSLSENFLYSVGVDNQDKVWVGTTEQLNRFDPITQRFEHFRYLPPKENLTDYPAFNSQARDFVAGAQVFCMANTPDGKILIGTSEKLNIYDPKTNTFTHQFNDERIRRLPGKNYNSIFVDKKGNIWVGWFGEVIRISPDLKTYTSYKHHDDDPNSLMDEGAICFAEDADGNIWMGTDEGLACLDVRTQRFTNYTKANGLPNNSTPSLVIVGNDMWIGTANGLARMDLRTRVITPFDRGDGLVVTDFETEAAVQDKTGQLLFGATRGLIQFNPKRIDQNRFIPPVYLTSLKVNDEEFVKGYNKNNPPSIELRHDQNFFTIEIAALSYDHPESNQYAYWLENFDKQWIKAGNRAFTSYTNIPPGNYVLHIQASNNDGMWNYKGYEVSIVIAPPFWQTWWFKLAVFLFVMLLGLYLYNQRIQLVRKEHQTEVRLLKEQQVLQEKLNQELGEKLDYQQKYEVSQKHRAEVEKKSLLLEREKAMAKYQNLVNQLNPHFLFNSLAVLDSLIFKEQKLASKYLRQLTKVYRYLIENDDVETVSMEKELRFAQDFISLLETRYNKGIEITMKIPEHFKQKRIVPVTIQNLLENAIKHNTTDIESPLCMDISVQDDYLVVQNNLQKRPIVSTSNKKGLADFQALYSYLTDRPVTTLETKSQFIVHIPLID